VIILLRGSGRAEKGVVAADARHRKGFGVVEVIVAMVLLAIAISSLASLVFSVSESGMRTAGDAYKNGVIMHEVNRLEGLPYDSIPNGSVAYAVTTGSYPHSRIVTVTEPAANIKTVRIVIAPANSRYRPDTVQFVRTRARTSKVLCTVCQ
jgi:pilin/secretion family protein with methylation motif